MKHKIIFATDASYNLTFFFSSSSSSSFFLFFELEHILESVSLMKRKKQVMTFHMAGIICPQLLCGTLQCEN